MSDEEKPYDHTQFPYRPAFDPKRERAPEPIDPRSVPADNLADTTEWDYKRLLYMGRDVLNIGKGRLVLTYAGRDPKRIQITCRNGKAAKRTQMLLRRDLRKVQSDAEYNRALDAFLQAIHDACEESDVSPRP